jgi:hypothetical protein
LKSVERALEVVYSHWGSRIERPGSVQKWIEKNRGIVCVVLFAQSGDEFVDFRYAAAQLRRKCSFAMVKGDGEWNISVYRSGQMGLSTVVKLRGKAMISEIDDRSSALFVRLTRGNYAEFCSEWCLGVISAGVPMALFKEFHDLPFNTVQVDPNSDFAGKLNGSTNDWVLFLGGYGWKKPETMEKNSLFVILWELWKNGGRPALMKRAPFVEVPFLAQQKKGRFW